MATKEDFLNNIASELGRERKIEVNPPVFNQNPWDHLYQEYNQEDYIDLFIQNLTELTGNVVRVTTKNELELAIKGIVQNEEAKTAILWRDSRLEDVDKYLSSFEVTTKIWNTSGNKEDLINFAEQADLGFTFAEMGLAETGSILLYNKGDLGRSVSLLPKVYVTLLRTKDIRPRITNALKQISEKHNTEGLPSLINFITGPSRSADIEMSLSIGVHGPGTVYVILLDY